MTDEDARRDLSKLAWTHIDAERFDQAEPVLRQLIEQVDPDDALSRWQYFGLLAGVLNSLDRPDEGTEMYRRALTEAQRLSTGSELGVAKYMLANQYLIFGDPQEALAEATPVPPGVGHVQCLRHAIAAHALWKLERQDESRVAAQDAIAACPTDDRRTQLSDELDYILAPG